VLFVAGEDEVVKAALLRLIEETNVKP